MIVKFDGFGAGTRPGAARRRRRAGAAIEQKCNGARGGIGGAVGVVGDVKQVGLRLAGFVLHRQRAGGGGVLTACRSA